MEYIEAFAGEFFLALAGLAGAVAAYYVRQHVKRVGKTYDLDDTRELAHSVVRFVEQVHKYVDGKEKYNIAKNRLIAIAEEKGIEITENQINTFIEEAVRSFRDEYGEDWAKFNTESTE